MSDGKNARGSITTTIRFSDEIEDLELELTRPPMPPTSTQSSVQYPSHSLSPYEKQADGLQLELRRLLGLPQPIIVIHRSEGTVSLCNAAAARLWGVSEDPLTLQGRHVRTLFAGEGGCNTDDALLPAVTEQSSEVSGKGFNATLQVRSTSLSPPRIYTLATVAISSW